MLENEVEEKKKETAALKEKVANKEKEIAALTKKKWGGPQEYGRRCNLMALIEAGKVEEARVAYEDFLADFFDLMTWSRTEKRCKMRGLSWRKPRRNWKRKSSSSRPRRGGPQG